MKILIYLLAAVIAAFFYIRYLEKKAVFYPFKEITSVPDDIGIGYEDIYFKTEDGVKLNGWFVKASEDAPVMIFFHGNAGNISGRLGRIDVFHRMGISVFIIDYRGFGLSEGVPTEQGMYLDAQAAFDYLNTREDVDQSKVFVYGVSLGGAAAVDLASKREVNGLIIDSSFSSGADMAKIIFPGVPSFLIRTKMDNLNKIRNIKAPKLIIHSTEDRTVPYELGRKLFDAASEPKKFLKIVGNHNESFFDDLEKNILAIELFLKENGMLN